MIRSLILSALILWINPTAGDEPVRGGDSVTTQTRELETFDSIELSIAADMNVTIGEPTPLTITANDKDLELIKMEVRKGKLIISTKRDSNFKKAPKIDVTVASLTAVEIIGAADMTVAGLDNESFVVASTGAADVRLSGRTKVLAVAATGAADVNAFDLSAQRATATLVGAADADLNVAEALTVTITGGGDVNYKGSPKLTQMIVGGGDVTQVD